MGYYRSNKNCSKIGDIAEIPELTEGLLQRAVLFVGDKLFRRGRPVGSVKVHPKAAVKIRLDADILEALRAFGDGWQTRVRDRHNGATQDLL